MNEVKMPKRPILAYYILIFLAIFLFNSIFVPMLRENAVKEVDYSSFMTMTENQEIDKVQVEQDKILFTKKDDKQAYKTALMNDPALIERLHKSGADFTGEIVEAMNPPRRDAVRHGEIECEDLRQADERDQILRCRR